MYLKNSLISILKIKNIFLLILGIAFAAISVTVTTELIVYYHGDWFTITHARSTPESVIYFILGVLMIVYSRISRKLINDACFFSGYFEGDLNGYVDFTELAEITGRTPEQIRSRLRLLRPLYMKNFRIAKTINYRYPEIIELYSKTVTCCCRSCGGWMEKRVYFTGVCPYCGSSDLTAQVVSGQHFYYINDNTNRKPNDPHYYEAPSLNTKRIWYAVGIGVALFFFLILLIVFMTTVSNYNNEEYFREMIGKGITSYELFQKDLMNLIIFSAFSLACSAIAFPFLLARVMSIEMAQSFARKFAQCPKPFLSLPELYQNTQGNSSYQSTSITPEIIYKRLVNTIKEGYLRGCTPEKHGGTLRIALAKQIVKDRCPGCGAPIVGAITENHSCRYCGRLIFGVIRKK